MDKINFEAFPPDELAWVRDFQAVLEALDVSDIDRHIALIDRAPHSATEDEIWLQEPCVYTLLLNLA